MHFGVRTGAIGKSSAARTVAKQDFLGWQSFLIRLHECVYGVSTRRLASRSMGGFGRRHRQSRSTKPATAKPFPASGSQPALTIYLHDRHLRYFIRLSDRVACAEPEVITKPLVIQAEVMW